MQNQDWNAGKSAEAKVTTIEAKLEALAAQELKLKKAQPWYQLLQDPDLVSVKESIVELKKDKDRLYGIMKSAAGNPVPLQNPPRFTLVKTLCKGKSGTQGRGEIAGNPVPLQNRQVKDEVQDRRSKVTTRSRSLQTQVGTPIKLVICTYD